MAQGDEPYSVATADCLSELSALVARVAAGPQRLQSPGPRFHESRGLHTRAGVTHEGWGQVLHCNNAFGFEITRAGVRSCTATMRLGSNLTIFPEPQAATSLKGGRREAGVNHIFDPTPSPGLDSPQPGFLHSGER